MLPLTKYSWQNGSWEEEIMTVYKADKVWIDGELVDWDQATVLIQLGVIPETLPALGATQANRLLDRDAPANELMRRYPGE